MGEAKRRKAILGDRYGSNESSLRRRPSLKRRVLRNAVQQGIQYWIRIDNLTTTEIKHIALAVVPKKLAQEFDYLEDTEQIWVTGDCPFPSDWPYSMRLVGCYEPGMEWVTGVCERWKDSGGAAKDMPMVMTNAVKLFCFAAMYVERQWDWGG